MPYIFKPRGRQADACAKAVEELRSAKCLKALNLSRFYEYATERALRDYRTDQDAFTVDLKEYLQARNTGEPNV